MFCNFFFFKQKTAYEMRISDWSSDVCSSDPLDFGTGLSGDTQRLHLHHHTTRLSWRWVQFPDFFAGARLGSGFRTGKTHRRGSGFENELAQRRCERFRSEEHTSELQSLMRISYAVFCLKKKKIKTGKKRK